MTLTIQGSRRIPRTSKKDTTKFDDNIPARSWYSMFITDEQHLLFKEQALLKFFSSFGCKLTNLQVRNVLLCGQLKSHKENYVLFSQHKPSELIYYIEQGELQVKQFRKQNLLIGKSKHGAGQVVSYYNYPRSQQTKILKRAKCLQQTVVLQLDFSVILKQFNRIAQKEQLLNVFFDMPSLTAVSKRQLLQSFELVVGQTGDKIDLKDSLAVLKRGTIQSAAQLIVRSKHSQSIKTVKLGIHTTPVVFGEQAVFQPSLKQIILAKDADSQIVLKYGSSVSISKLRCMGTCQFLMSDKKAVESIVLGSAAVRSQFQERLKYIENLLAKRAKIILQEIGHSTISMQSLREQYMVANSGPRLMADQPRTTSSKLRERMNRDQSNTIKKTLQERQQLTELDKLQQLKQVIKQKLNQLEPREIMRIVEEQKQLLQSYKPVEPIRIRAQIPRQSTDIFDQLKTQRVAKLVHTQLVKKGIKKPAPSERPVPIKSKSNLLIDKITKKLDSQRIIVKPPIVLWQVKQKQQPSVTLNVVKEYNRRMSVDNPGDTFRSMTSRPISSQKDLAGYAELLQLLKKKKRSKQQPIQMIQLKQPVIKPSTFKPFKFQEHLLSKGRLSLRGWFKTTH